MQNPSLKEVVRLADPIKAEMLRSVLANEGIESVLFEGMISQLAPHHCWPGRYAPDGQCQ